MLFSETCKIFEINFRFIDGAYCCSCECKYESTSSIQKLKSTGGMCFYVKQNFIMNIKFRSYALVSD